MSLSNVTVVLSPENSSTKMHKKERQKEERADIFRGPISKFSILNMFSTIYL